MEPTFGLAYLGIGYGLAFLGIVIYLFVLLRKQRAIEKKADELDASKKLGD